MRGWLTDPNKVFSYYTCFDRQTRPQSHFTHQSSVEPHIYRLVTIQLQGKLAAVCELVSVEKCLNIWTKWTQEDSPLAGLFRTGFCSYLLAEVFVPKLLFRTEGVEHKYLFSVLTKYSISPLHIIEWLKKKSPTNVICTTTVVGMNVGRLFLCSTNTNLTKL